MAEKNRKERTNKKQAMDNETWNQIIDVLRESAAVLRNRNNLFRRLGVSAATRAEIDGNPGMYPTLADKLVRGLEEWREQAGSGSEPFHNLVSSLRRERLNLVADNLEINFGRQFGREHEKE